jgi:hypothetical protein
MLIELLKIRYQIKGPAAHRGPGPEPGRQPGNMAKRGPQGSVPSWYAGRCVRGLSGELFGRKTEPKPKTQRFQTGAWMHH